MCCAVCVMYVSSYLLSSIGSQTQESNRKVRIDGKEASDRQLSKHYELSHFEEKFDFFQNSVNVNPKGGNG